MRQQQRRTFQRQHANTSVRKRRAGGVHRQRHGRILLHAATISHHANQESDPAQVFPKLHVRAFAQGGSDFNGISFEMKVMSHI